MEQFKKNNLTSLWTKCVQTPNLERICFYLLYSAEMHFHNPETIFNHILSYKYQLALPWVTEWKLATVYHVQTEENQGSWHSKSQADKGSWHSKSRKADWGSYHSKLRKDDQGSLWHNISES